ncbi:hypothetical protein ACHAXA_005516 [Cyclostephanos tholiformis]|uniref:subtilisin n=1 Tax=Cyclostephanos tholiformis TaxID=382380 RepID=A0ABD3RBL7_9STRA
MGNFALTPVEDPQAQIRRVSSDSRRIQAQEEVTPWGIEAVNVRSLWTIEPKLQRVKICVVDTGYDVFHPDLPFFNVDGWNRESECDGTRFKNEKWFNDTDGDVSHGTHVAGIIGAIGNNGCEFYARLSIPRSSLKHRTIPIVAFALLTFKSISPRLKLNIVGVVGINPNSTRISFHIAKIKQRRNIRFSDVLDAAEECKNAGAYVISMAVSCKEDKSGQGKRCFSPKDEARFKKLYDEGVLIVGGAGNTANSTEEYPAAYKYIMSVSAVDENLLWYNQSTRNNQVEISAPGVNIYSTFAGGTYGTLNGTSQATAHVVGVAALLISHFPECTKNQIRNAMLATTNEPNITDQLRNRSGWDERYGWGIVNAGRAYELLNTKGCECAGGVENGVPSLSDLAFGGKDQKVISPCTPKPTSKPTFKPSRKPTSSKPSQKPTTSKPSRKPTTSWPTRKPTTRKPTK